MGKRVNMLIELHKEGHFPEASLEKMAEFKNKIAATPSPWLFAAITAGLGAGLSAGGFGLNTYLQHKSERDLEGKKTPAYRAMLRQHPTLGTEDVDTVKAYYNSLWHFAPSVAQDPVAAGGYVRQAMQFHDQGGPGIPAISELAETEKDFRQAREGFDVADTLLSPVTETFKKVAPSLGTDDFKV